MMQKPFSQACENNKRPISETLKSYIENGGVLLEIGSGTGQHGAFISQQFAKLTWQTSDQEQYLDGIRTWVADAQQDNFKAPIELNVNNANWTRQKVDFVFSANTAHIMAMEEVEKLFGLIPTFLKPKGLFFLYGPFNYNGAFTSESNARFNDHLKAVAPHQGIRDFEIINQLAIAQGLRLSADHEMPANNRMLVWELVDTQ
jgi:cyclopropane fatty-acyl-phospholipid synthase-like methyltransferase